MCQLSTEYLWMIPTTDYKMQLCLLSNVDICCSWQIMQMETISSYQNLFKKWHFNNMIFTDVTLSLSIVDCMHDMTIQRWYHGNDNCRVCHKPELIEYGNSTVLGSGGWKMCASIGKHCRLCTCRAVGSDSDFLKPPSRPMWINVLDLHLPAELTSDIWWDNVLCKRTCLVEQCQWTQVTIMSVGIQWLAFYLFCSENCVCSQIVMI